MNRNEQNKNLRVVLNHLESSTNTIQDHEHLLQDAMSTSKDLTSNSMKYDKLDILQCSKEGIMPLKNSDADESFKRMTQREALQNILKEAQKVKIFDVTKRDKYPTMTRVMSQEEVLNARNSFSSMTGLRFEEPKSTKQDIHHPEFDLTRPIVNISKTKQQKPRESSNEAEKKRIENEKHDVNGEYHEHHEVGEQIKTAKIFKVKSIKKGTASEITGKPEKIDSGIEKSLDIRIENFKSEIVQKKQSVIDSELPKDEITTVSPTPPSVKDLMLDRAYLEHETFLATQVLACKGDVFTFLLQHRSEQEKLYCLTKSASFAAEKSDNMVNNSLSKLDDRWVRSQGRDCAEKDQELAATVIRCDNEQDSGEVMYNDDESEIFSIAEDANQKMENNVILPGKNCIFERDNGLFPMNDLCAIGHETKQGQKEVQDKFFVEHASDENIEGDTKTEAKESDKSILDERKISPDISFDKEQVVKEGRCDEYDSEKFAHETSQMQKIEIESLSSKEKCDFIGNEGVKNAESPCGKGEVLEYEKEELVKKENLTVEIQEQ